jgi:diguanylate cyclase (GGDEF)-like protein/PAS domain S-box-containing protein
VHIYKQLSEAYSNLKLSILGVLANATVLIYIFFGHTNNIILIIWGISILLISAFRYLSLLKYKTDKTPLYVDKWQKFLFIGIVLSALSWGFTPFLFFIPGNYIYQMVLIVILAGVSAGSISTLAHIRFNIQLYLLIVLIPLIIELLLQKTEIHNDIALLVSLYLLLLLTVAKRFNQTYLDSITSQLMFEEKKEEFLESEQKFKAIFNSVPIGILFYDTNLVIQEVNDGFVDFIAAPKDFLIGLDLEKSRDRSLMPAFKAPLDGICGFYEGEYTTLYRQKDLWVSMSTSPLRNSENKIIGAVGIITDITGRMLTQLQIEHQAHHDTLTDIPNRANLKEEIAKNIIRFQRHGVIFAIIFLDLDHFKNINDSLGHDVGDKLLIETAIRLKKSIRDEDMVARIGGDEFVILLPDLSIDEFEAAKSAEIVSQKIHEILRAPFLIDGYTLNISSSLGITFINTHSQSEDELLKHADIAMYESKKDGRNTTRFYQESMDQWIKRRLEVENELKNAIKNNELRLVYQPVVEFATSKVIGMEALIRWKSQKLGDMYPDEFITIAEESGMILSIGEWVMQEAVSQFMTWQKKFAHTTDLKKIAVNVSVHQFNAPDFLTQVENIIAQSGIVKEHLELELTESIIVKDITGVRNKMQQLRDLGVNLSIDDFGTGYSSLSYLKKLPFTTLKIDKSFTQDIGHDIDDKELISTIITIAENFNLEVVIEGVETYEQYAFVNERKATFMQGYYCSKPMEKESFEAMLESSNGICSIMSEAKEKI